MKSTRSHPPRRAIGPSAALMAATLAAVLGTGVPALAANTLHNVSLLVLGSEEPLPGAGVNMACGAQCRYASISGAQMDNGYTAWPGAYAMADWPVQFTAPPPAYRAVIDSLAIAAPPAGSAYQSLPGGVWQRARVAYNYLPETPATLRQIDVQTHRSGSGASATSYAVRIDTPAGGARRTFLKFALPVLQRDGIEAGYIGGPSGNQPFTVQPARLQARAAVDVYIDGLPVWSSESVLLRPRRYAAYGLAPFTVEHGPALEAGSATLFLGTLPAGSSRTAVIVMRSDLRVDQNTCYTVPNTLGTDLRRCDNRLEGLRLPSKSTAPLYLHSPDISVYTQ